MPLKCIFGMHSIAVYDQEKVIMVHVRYIVSAIDSTAEYKE